MNVAQEWQQLAMPFVVAGLALVALWKADAEERMVLLAIMVAIGGVALCGCSARPVAAPVPPELGAVRVLAEADRRDCPRPDACSHAYRVSALDRVTGTRLAGIACCVRDADGDESCDVFARWAP